VVIRKFAKYDIESFRVKEDLENLDGGDGFAFRTPLEGLRSMDQAQSISVSQGSGEKEKQSAPSSDECIC